MPRWLLLLALSACGADPDAPRIEAIAPTHGPAGATVTITGERFCGRTVEVTAGGACEPLPVGSVSFGIDPEVGAALVSWRDQRIEAIVPVAADGDVLVVVTVDGRSSNGVSFRAE